MIRWVLNDYCARQSLGRGKKDGARKRVNRQPPEAIRQMKVLNRKGLAIHRKRVLRGAGVTPPAKRTQGMCRPCDGASNAVIAEPTLIIVRKATAPMLYYGQAKATRCGRQAGEQSESAESTDERGEPPAGGKRPTGLVDNWRDR